MKQINKLRIKLYHFINGLWSQIPLCCVIYFCTGEQEGKALNSFLRRNPDKTINEFTDDLTGYVRCDSCYKNDISVNIKKNGRVCFFLMTPKEGEDDVRNTKIIEGES